MSYFERLVSVPHLNQTALYSIWEDFIGGKPIDESKVFIDTHHGWLRCAALKLDPQAYSRHELSQNELQERRNQLKDVLLLMEPHFKTMESTLNMQSPNYVIALADQEGYLLEVRKGSNDGQIDTSCVFHGACFTEEFMGNNGVGSVLVTGKPLAVIGAEHYLKEFHQWSCVGAPIYDFYGKLIAVIEISTPCGSESPYTFSLVSAVAKAVEAGLKHLQMERQFKEASITLSHLRQQREIIFNQMSQAVIIANEDGIITFFNKAARSIWNIPEDKIQDKPFAFFDLVDCPRKDPLVLKSLREGIPYTNLECRCNDKILLINTSLLRDEQGNPCGAIGIYTDVTEIRRQESRIRDQEKLAVVGQMAAGMAHEIRNPLTSIRGFAQLIREKMKKSQQGYQEYMEIMIREIDQIDSFIENFLQLSRPKPPEMKIDSINAVISAFVQVFESQAFLHRVKLHTSLPEVPKVLMDKNKIKQVLLNLCQNAIQAMEQGGDLLLTTEYHQSEKEICITVADNGPGIPPESLAQIGTPFYTTKDKGTGLGLSISYAIIDQHKGRVEVDSKLGEGTKFLIYLPC